MPPERMPGGWGGAWGGNKLNMFRAVYSMIHDVILWNGDSLKQNLFSFKENTWLDWSQSSYTAGLNDPERTDTLKS